MRTSSALLLAGLSAIALAATPAFAQDNANASDTGGIQDIVVTAQKKAENLQNVPISITAVSAEQFERMQAPTLQGLNGSITNAQINNFSNTPNTAVVTIRGIGVIEPDPYAGNTVSIVVDGIPQFFSMGALVDMYDVQRVEVLKGPQGTLFGANTTGGVVNIVSVQPGDKLGGKVEGTYGNWNRFQLSGAIDLPVSDVLKTRWVVSHFQRDGFLTNVVNGKDIGKKDTTIFRGIVKYEPSSDFDATLQGEYDRGRNGAPELTISAAPAEDGPSRTSPGDIISYGPESLWIDPSVVTNMYGQPCPSRFDKCSAPKKFYGANNSVPDTSNLDTYRASLTLNARNTGIGDITSITGYKKFRVFEYTDQDSSPLFLDDTRRKTRGWQFSQELRTTADLTDKWSIIAGGFYLKTHYNHVQDFRINFASVPFVVPDDPLVPGAPVFQQNLQAQDQWSASMFAQTYYNITDSLKFQAGIRWSHEHTKMHASTLTYLPADYANGIYYPDQYTFDCATICGTNFGGPDVTGAKSWNDLGWKIGLDFKVNPTTMLFASWARGFKSGGFAGRLGIAQDLGPYNPEKVDTFEAGVKADLFDRHVRFNLTGFYTNYRDIQLAEIYFLNTVPPTQGNTILNAAKAHIKGFELETTVMPFEGLTLNGSLGYLDAKFTDFPFIDPFSLSPANPTGITYNFKGHRLQNAPKYTAVLGASYEIPIGENKLQLNATYKYTSSKYLTAIDNARRSWIQPTHLVDANAEFFYQDRFSISLWGKNIFDKRYIQSVYDNFGYGALVSYQNPREYGVTVKANF